MVKCRPFPRLQLGSPDSETLSFDSGNVSLKRCQSITNCFSYRQIVTFACIVVYHSESLMTQASSESGVEVITNADVVEEDELGEIRLAEGLLECSEATFSWLKLVLEHVLLVLNNDCVEEVVVVIVPTRQGHFCREENTMTTTKSVSQSDNGDERFKLTHLLRSRHRRCM